MKSKEEILRKHLDKIGYKGDHENTNTMRAIKNAMQEYADQSKGVSDESVNVEELDWGLLTREEVRGFERLVKEDGIIKAIIFYKEWYDECLKDINNSNSRREAEPSIIALNGIGSKLSLSIKYLSKLLGIELSNTQEEKPQTTEDSIEGEKEIDLEEEMNYIGDGTEFLND